MKMKMNRVDNMTDNKIIKALECCVHIGENENCNKCKYNQEYLHGSSLLMDALALIKRLQKENDDLFFKLNGVMWSVDKWLEGEELKQDEVNRAITMREKTLQITEKLQAEVEKWEKKGEFIVSKCDDILLNIEKHNQQFLECIASVKSEARKEFAEMLKRYKAYVSGWDIYVVREHHIDNLLKEMEGEE